MPTGRLGRFYVNKDHALLRGAAAWWLARPPWSGGAYFVNILAPGQLLGNRTGGGGSVKWQAPQDRPGGMGALLLDGNSASIVTDKQPLDWFSATAGTLAGWFNQSNAWSTQNPYLFGKSNGGANANSQYRLEFFSGSIFFTLGDSGTQNTQVSTAWSPSANTWYHVAVTWNGNTTFYVNGKSLAAAQTQGTWTYTATFPDLQLGNDTVKNGSNSRGFNGYMDDLLVVGRAWTDGEVNQWYNLSRAGYPGILSRRRAWMNAPAGAVTIPNKALIVQQSVANAAFL
jgi:hypothetical protein